tara:strand:- start:84 stop:401 length:318 start_codon:yes stop_codon:yes gene_type:complete
MATLEEFVTQVTAEVEAEKPLFMANGDDKIEFTDDDYDWIINNRANELYWQQENGWKVSRQDQYPDIGDQLDMLYHAIDGNETLKSQFSDFHTALKEVKDNNPKP